MVIIKFKQWADVKHLLNRCRDINSYKLILRKLSNSKEGLKASEISSEKNVYSKINLLIKKEIIEKINPSSNRKMLVDLDGINKKPCFNAEQIQERLSEYGSNLYAHAKSEKMVMKILVNVLKSSDTKLIKDFFQNILAKGNLKKYNKIIELLKESSLFEKIKGYGRLNWRPQRVNRYKLTTK